MPLKKYLKTLNIKHLILGHYSTRYDNIELFKEEAQTIFTLVHETNGLKNAQVLAEEYTEKALKEIAKLPNRPVGVKEALLEITKMILHREN